MYYLYSKIVFLHIKYLLNINKIIKIQSIFRTKYIQHINKLKGPGLFNRKICTNEEDFIHLRIKIKYYLIISFHIKKNIVYCSI